MEMERKSDENTRTLVEYGHSSTWGDLADVIYTLDRLQQSQIDTWGYTIYRTAYGPGSDERWQQFLAVLQKKVADEVAGEGGLAEDVDPNRYCDKLHSMFRLDTKSEAEALNAASMDRVRELFRGNPDREPLAAKYAKRGVFLYVDDEVFAAIEAKQPWVKAVEADYEPESHRGNWRTSGQRYFGWMMVADEGLWRLWDVLELKPLWSVAPWTDQQGNHTVVWEGCIHP